MSTTSTQDSRCNKFVPAIKKSQDKTLLAQVSALKRGSTIGAELEGKPVRGVLNGAIARSRELRRQARKAALKDAVDNLKAKTGRSTQDNLYLDEIRPLDRKSVCSEEMDHQNSSKDDNFAESGFMATFRSAVQRAYDSVGDPEKEGVNDADLSNILSKLGYSSEDRETQNILSAAATRTDIDRNNMKFQDIFKLVVGKNEEETLADITNAFEIFDRDDDGKLQTKDLHRALTRIGDDPFTEEEFQEIIVLAELDPDFEAFFDYKDLTNHKLSLGYASAKKEIPKSSLKVGKSKGKFRKLSKVNNVFKRKGGDKSNRNSLDPSACDLRGSRTSLSDYYTTDDSGDQRSLPNSSPTSLAPEKKSEAAAKGVFKRWLRTTERDNRSSSEVDTETAVLEQECTAPIRSPKSRKKKLRSPISWARKRKASSNSPKQQPRKLTTLEYIQCNIKVPPSYSHTDVHIEGGRFLSAITDARLLEQSNEIDMEVEVPSLTVLRRILLQSTHAKPPRIKIEDEYRNILNSSFETESISAMSPSSQISRDNSIDKYSPNFFPEFTAGNLSKPIPFFIDGIGPNKLIRSASLETSTVNEIREDVSGKSASSENFRNSGGSSDNRGNLKKARSLTYTPPTNMADYTDRFFGEDAGVSMPDWIRTDSLSETMLYDKLPPSPTEPDNAVALGYETDTEDQIMSATASLIEDMTRVTGVMRSRLASQRSSHTFIFDDCDLAKLSSVFNDDDEVLLVSHLPSPSYSIDSLNSL